MTCPLCDDTGFKDHAGFRMDPCDHRPNSRPNFFNLLEPATDWTRQTLEERLEHCTSLLSTQDLLAPADCQRTLNRIRAWADIQREERANARLP